MSRRSRSNSYSEAPEKRTSGGLPKTDENESQSNHAEKSIKKTVSSVSLSSVGSGKSSNKRLLLSATDPDTWVNKIVTLIDGKYDGMIGRVLRSGNGWVQVEVDGTEVPKRAYELEVERDDNAQFNVENNKPNRNVNRKMTTSSNSETRASESSINNDNGDSKTTADTNSAGEEEKQSDMKISIHLRQAKRLQIQKYVDRHQETIKDRPDLTYWLHQINGIMVDNIYESEISRNFVDHKCHVCNVEKWPDSKFCWNRACKSSPIFYNYDGNNNIELIGNQDIYYHSIIVEPQITEISSPSSKKKGSNNIKSPRSPLPSTFSNKSSNCNSSDKNLLSIDGTPMLNSVTDYLIHAPAQIIGYDYREKMKLDSNGNAFYETYAPPQQNNHTTEKNNCDNSPKKKMKL